MITYYTRLAWYSVKATPIMSALTVLTIAIGIGVYMTTFSLFYMMSQNPIEHKDNQLFAVQLDSWGPNESFGHDISDMPSRLTYQDSRALRRSDIPSRQVAMYRYGMAVTPSKTSVNPYIASLRVTTRDFFAMFDVPFLYGSSWSVSAEQAADKVAVIDSETNNKLFDGRNSIGESIEMNGNLFTVVGVLDTWDLGIKVYDLDHSPFDTPESIYIPFALTEPMQLSTWGNMDGWKSSESNSYESFLGGEDVWVQHWVELPRPEDFQKFSLFIENYIKDQKLQGRFQRPLKYSLSKPSQWLVQHQVVSQDNKILVWLSLGFLLVCTINAAALMLAKFIRKAPEAGVRRALGASRQAIFIQHIIESGFIGFIGGLLGITLALLGLLNLKTLFMGSLDNMAQMNFTLLILAVLIALCSSVLAGFYPAWRIGKTNPAFYLKTQ